MDLVFIVDSSGSIRDKNPADGSYDNFALIKLFINDIINHLPVSTFQTRIGLVDFSDFANSIFYLNTYNSATEVKNAVNNIPYYFSNTNTSGALRVMRSDQFVSFRGDRPNVRNVAVLITDGVSTVDRTRTISDAVAARNDDITIFCVGVTNSVRESELRDISSPPQRRGSTYWIAPTFLALDNVVTTIITTVCSYQKPATPGRNVVSLCIYLYCLCSVHRFDSTCPCL